MSKNKFVIFGILSIIGVFFYACQSETDITYARYYTVGKQLYESHCGNCHGNTGGGLAMLYPPLTDSRFLKQNKTKLACFIKNGLQGQIIVSGKNYEGIMPAESTLSNIEIAEIITYITNSFGNKQGIYPYQKVSADLKKCSN
ncbi:MAG: c-type cytochrome [Sphingobacteriaceae bacterium]